MLKNFVWALMAMHVEVLLAGWLYYYYFLNYFRLACMEARLLLGEMNKGKNFFLLAVRFGF